MSRSYELIIHDGRHPKCVPFYLTVTIEWQWDASLSAHYKTTEVDMLMEIFGDFGIYDDDTVPPRLRMDICLSAGLVYSDPIQTNVQLLEDDQLSLERVTSNAWQAIKLPREWDDPEKRDPYPDDVLADFAIRIAKAINILENSLARLVEGKA